MPLAYLCSTSFMIWRRLVLRGCSDHSMRWRRRNELVLPGCVLMSADDVLQHLVPKLHFSTMHSSPTSKRGCYRASVAEAATCRKQLDPSIPDADQRSHLRRRTHERGSKGGHAAPWSPKSKWSAPIGFGENTVNCGRVGHAVGSSKVFRKCQPIQ